MKNANTPAITYLITHSGAFHADEVCASVILTALFPEAEVLRTRDAAVMETHAPSAIIYDVGGIFDHNDRRYDHHQLGSPEREQSNISYSSFGLIWHYYGFRYLRQCLGMPPSQAAAVAHAFDTTLVRDIDALDNGEIREGQEALLHYTALPALIVDQRPDFDNDDPQAEEDCFHAAVDLARTLINTKLRNINANQRAEIIVLRALRDRKDPRYIELPQGMSYDKVIHDEGAEEVLFVINPARGEWQLNTVAQELGKYGARKDLPSNWAGLRDEDLAKETGVEDAVFCHQGRFIAIAKTREGILEMLKQALAY